LPYGFSHWDKLPTEIKDVITSYATGQLIHERRQNKEAVELRKELELYSMLRMIWRRFGHVRINYLKCYNHSYLPTYDVSIQSNVRLRKIYLDHQKVYVNYKKVYYCYINYIGEYVDRKTKRKCEMVILRGRLRSSLSFSSFYIQEKIKKATSIAINNKCNHDHCLCFS
jgi:hypothetical protein